jgi:hypothetical protein
MPEPSHFNAFGSPVVPPSQLTQPERLELLRRAVGAMQRGQRLDRLTGQWLALVLAEHQRDGADLAKLLGTKRPRGNTMTPTRIAAADHHAALLLRLSVACGGDRAAVRVLAGAPCPAGATQILGELAESKGPRSLAAFTRARARGVSSHRPKS